MSVNDKVAVHFFLPSYSLSCTFFSAFLHFKSTCVFFLGSSLWSSSSVISADLCWHSCNKCSSIIVIYSPEKQENSLSFVVYFIQFVLRNALRNYRNSVKLDTIFPPSKFISHYGMSSVLLRPRHIQAPWKMNEPKDTQRERERENLMFSTAIIQCFQFSI